jgi:hypothetical protein
MCKLRNPENNVTPLGSCENDVSEERIASIIRMKKIG